MPSFWQQCHKVLCPAAALAILLALGGGAGRAAKGPSSKAVDATASQYKTATLLLDDLRSVPDFELSPEQYLLVIRAFQRVYSDGADCSFCDASLLAVAQLYREIGDRFDQKAYREEALKAYRLLLEASPPSMLRPEAEKAIREIAGGVEVPAPPPAKSPSPQPERTEVPEIGQDIHDDEAGIEVQETDAADGGDAAAQTSQPAAEARVVPASTHSAAAESKNDRAVARVKDVRFWTHPKYTRVVIELDERVRHKYDEIPNPDRLYVDFIGALLPADLRRDSTIAVGDSLLKQIRVGQNTRTNTRIVFDFQRRPHFTTSWLSNPPRLVVELRSEAPLVLTKAGAGKTHPPAQPELLAAATSVEKALPVARDTRSSAPARAAARYADLPPRQDSVPEARALAALRAPDVSVGLPVIPDVSDAVELSTVRPAQPDLPPAKAAEAASTGNRNLIRALGLKVGRVVIDAGHGGHDTGSIGPTGLREKDVVLDIGLRLGKLIEEGLGSEVIYTRTNDAYRPLQRRTDLANESSADLFISVHANASSDARIRGVETYYLNFTTNAWAMAVASRENATAEHSVHELQDLVSKIALKERLDESREFASKVQAALHGGLERNIKGLRNRGVRKAPLMVLIGAEMPSVLAEIGFISNRSDEKLLKGSKFRQKVAQYIYDGVEAYAQTLSHVRVAQKQAAAP